MRTWVGHGRQCWCEVWTLTLKFQVTIQRDVTRTQQYIQALSLRNSRAFSCTPWLVIFYCVLWFLMWIYFYWTCFRKKIHFPCFWQQLCQNWLHWFDQQSSRQTHNLNSPIFLVQKNVLEKYKSTTSPRWISKAAYRGRLKERTRIVFNQRRRREVNDDKLWQ